MRIYWIAGFLLFILQAPAFSDSRLRDIFRIAPSSISAELTQNSILHILQGKSGDLWISTLDGISRFNGHQLINYRPVNSDKNFIASVKIRKIIESPGGDIYVATQDHFYKELRSNGLQVILNSLEFNYSDDLYPVFDFF